MHIFPPLIRRRAVLAMLAAVVLGCGALATAPALAANTSHTTVGTSSSMANLPVKKATISCQELADSTTSVSGLPVQVAEYQVGSYAAGDPQYCALTGHIATYIGFEILLPTTTWRQRYLQTGCGGLCGSIGISAPESTGYQALEDGYFVVASDDEGHSGSSDSWYSNKAELVDFAYQSDHDLAVVAKGLAAKFYGSRPRYSYFDGCSQGGHEALTEVQRYPQDFNGVLAGAPAAIMTELNSILHEYETAVNIDSAGHPIVTEADAELVGDAALKACDPKTGLMLDYLSCEQRFNINTLLCTNGITTNCLSSEQIKVMEEIYDGPRTPTGQQLYPGGYPLGSEWGLGLPTSTSTTLTKDTMFAAWLEYFAFEKDIGVTGIDDEPFTAAYFKQIEKLAPFWDATDPDLSSFERSGGKLVLWQGESIPSISSIAYYQAVVRAMGGVASTQQFARYYLLPGVGHCGSGAPDTYAGLASVVSWTETGKAPTGSVVRSDTLFPYPELPAYNGHGNVDDASSYVGRVSEALEQPVHWLGKFSTVQEWCDSSGTDCGLVR